MTKTIDVTYDAENMALNIQQTDEEIRQGELLEWVFHNMPAKCSPMIVFKSIIRDDGDNDLRYYGPFLAITQEIPGADGGRHRVWGIVTNPFNQSYEYRAVISKGVGEDPFDEPYGNSPDTVGKAIVVSTEGLLRKESHEMMKERPSKEMREILELADGANPLSALRGKTKVVPITEKTVDGEPELVIHDDWLWIQRDSHDRVIWDFSLVPRHQGWFPMVDFIGGEGMAYVDIKNMHFGPFCSLTYTIGRVIGSGHGEVPGGYHYRVAMAEISSNKMAFKSSPDPVVDYPEPGSSGSGN